MTLSYKDVADIIKMVDASQCEELIVELEGVRIVVRRGEAAGTREAAPARAAVAAPGAAAPATPAPAPAAAVASASAAGSIAAGSVVAGGGAVVRAPMTGTFYRAPSPTEPPFVEVGSIVKAGDALCMIEVMKLFTTMTAETGGRIARVFAANAELVQIDQPLFVIEPASG